MSQLHRLFCWSLLCTILLLVSAALAQLEGPDLQEDGDFGDAKLPLGGISASHDDPFGYSSSTCKPCVCHKIKSGDGVRSISSVVNCSDQNLTRIPITLPNSTSSLNFSGNRLAVDLDYDESISMCERYHDLTDVSFAENELQVLPKVLRGCQNSLEDLTLTGNKLIVTNQLAFEQLQGLHSLRGLWVTNQLPRSVFKPLVTLSRLELTYTAAILPEDLFKPLTSLRVLWLTLDGTQNLPDGMTLPSGLTELRLRGIKLKHLPAGFLKNLDNIRTLHVDLPELRHLEWTPEDIVAANLVDLTVKGVWEMASESLAQMTSLVSLTLQDIRTLTDTAFFNHLGNLKRLKNLEIVNCSLASDTLQWIQNLRTLTSLTLKQTQLSKLSPDALSGLSVLQNLDLSFNKLKEFPVVPLLHVSDTLEVLDLSMNLLTHLNTTSFPSMPSLKALDLSQNRLASLDLKLLMRTPSLSQLIAHGNALKDVSGDQIMDTVSVHLSFLDLSSNLLETIPDGVPLEKVATLDMSKNPLTLGFPVSRLDEFLTKPTVVELRKTPIACHCEMYSLVALGALNGGICSSPPSVRLQAMDLETMYKLCNKTEDDIITAPKSLTAPVEPEEQDEEQQGKEEEDDDDWTHERTLGPVKIDNDSSFTSTLTELQSVTAVSTEKEQGTKTTLPDGVNYTTDQGKRTIHEDHGPYGVPVQTYEHSSTTDYPKQMSSSILPPDDETDTRNGTIVTPLVTSHGNYSDASPTEKNYEHIDATNNVNDQVTDIAKTQAPNTKCSNCSQEGTGKQNNTNSISDYNRDSSTPLLSWKGRLDDIEKGGVTASNNNMSSHLGHKGSTNGSDTAGLAAGSDHGFIHLPWLIAVCFLLILLVLVYLVCRRMSYRGSHDLADDPGNENKVITHGKMELMELGVAPPGGMPVIM